MKLRNLLFFSLVLWVGVGVAWSVPSFITLTDDDSTSTGTEVHQASFELTATGNYTVGGGSVQLRSGGNIVFDELQLTGNVVFETDATMDTTDPVITLITPSTDYAGFSAVPVFTGYVDDSDTSIDNARTTLLIDDIPQSGLQITGNSFTWNSGNFLSGYYVLKIVTYDVVGNSSEVERNFIIDELGPLILFNSHTPGDILRTSSPTITGSYLDFGVGGVSSTNSEFRINFIDYTTDLSVSTDSFTWDGDVNLPNGYNDFKISLEDELGNKAEQTITLYIDTTTPSAEVIIPSDNAWVNTDWPTVAGNIVEDDSGIDTDNSSVTFDGNIQLSGLYLSNSFMFFSLSTSASQGNHMVVFDLKDLAGNEFQTSRTFQIDSLAPSIEFTSPASESVVNDRTQTISGNLIELGSGIDSLNSKIYMDGVEQTGLTLTTNTFSWTPSSNLDWGQRTATLVLKDIAGNSSTGYLSFTVNVDSDGDGMDDEWELTYMGNLSNGASGDYDGDGLSNLQEFKEGGRPDKGWVNDVNDTLKLRIFTKFQE